MLTTLRSRLLFALPLTGALAATPLLASPAQAGNPTAHAAARRTIHVIDDSFAPFKIRVHRGTTIVWSWSDQNVNTHDVKLVKAPRGVRHFRSGPASQSYTFRRKLTRKGVYRFVCTFHVGMRGEIIVR